MINRQSHEFSSNLEITALTTGKIALAIARAIIPKLDSNSCDYLYIPTSALHMYCASMNLCEGGNGCDVMFEVVVEELGEECRADTRLHLLFELLNVLCPWHGEVPLQALGKRRCE